MTAQGTRSRLRRLARAAPARAASGEPEAERCDLCAAPIPPEHRHLLDVEGRRIMCACHACSVLMNRPGAGGGHYRALSERRVLLEDFDLDDATWQALRIPVDMAFFFHSGPAERVVAFYPSPMGATESELELAAWEDIAARNPVLEEMEPDVEALLVNRAQGARQHWIVGVDRCYELVGLIRMQWRGLAGGERVWEEIERFFATLADGAQTRKRDLEEA